ncbi:restriction endonuclease subunit S [Avibacterium paragallinarum]|uniref:restriction endonuclease subunit S n=1 Tax=Avibacterium paragallinarum TaxID=728 RepID=UPI00021AD1C9|nr:restriction endonuclease subunit S [Avibacterium paragallinarum]QIR12690.1 restriction endonuclease subunit S [Avibacterium paragallinarum]QJE10426.1 restriction endonuclease subunit S [Avibacterium paragallinarum]QJE12619.1 restriction endonuclease subunit S [Avibacterium paragallinarum]QJE14823.1 restriction endonuclease subunit S [Avibacterium paragallinarum]QJE17020.1 restriction endonuclease subunit S [Avibacterium paragallinarum]
MLLKDIAFIESGTPLSRINQINEKNVPSYALYDQADLLADFELQDVIPINERIFTWDNVLSLIEGDIVFGLMSGLVASVSSTREGHIISNNFVRLRPKIALDTNFLVYLLNQDSDIKRQFTMSLQGSTVRKYSVSQLRMLELGKLPPLEIQRRIGRVYQMERRLQTIKKRLASNETALKNHYLAQVLRGKNVSFLYC